MLEAEKNNDAVAAVGAAVHADDELAFATYHKNVEVYNAMKQKEAEAEAARAEAEVVAASSDDEPDAADAGTYAAPEQRPQLPAEPTTFKNAGVRLFRGVFEETKKKWMVCFTYTSYFLCRLRFCTLVRGCVVVRLQLQCSIPTTSNTHKSCFSAFARGDTIPSKRIQVSNVEVCIMHAAPCTVFFTHVSQRHLQNHHNFVVAMKDEKGMDMIFSVWEEYSKLKDSGKVDKPEGFEWAAKVSAAALSEASDKRKRSRSLLDIGVTKRSRVEDRLSGLFGVRSAGELEVKMMTLRTTAFLVGNHVAFNVVNSVLYKGMMSTYGASSASPLTLVKEDVLRTKGLFELYALVVDYLTVQLNEAGGFSISTDIWTSRSAHHSLMCIVYHWVDPKTLLPSEGVLDVMPLYTSHTAANVARMLARRIDLHTAAHHELFMATTDNGANVVKAAKHLILRHNECINGNVEALADANADDDAEGEDERAVGCIAHTIALAVTDGLKIKDVDITIAKVRRRGGAHAVHELYLIYHR